MSASRFVPLLPALLLTAPAGGAVIHVDAAAIGAADGTSWADAVPSLRDALAAAAPGDEVWVAAGVYRPDQGSGVTPGDRDATFTLPDQVAVFGGFAGTEGSLAERAGLYSSTVLSGDLNGDDLPGFVNTAENSRIVVTSTSVLNGTNLLDGFSIEGASNDGLGAFLDGGGLRSVAPGVHVTLANCRFRKNEATKGGGALIDSFDALDMSDCVFEENRAEIGGGLYSHTDGGVQVVRCAFTDNHAVGLPNSQGGGAASIASDGLRFVECEFIGNETVLAGGGMSVSSGSNDAELLRCLFAENAAVTGGGGLAVHSSSGGVVASCVFIGNQADTGGGLRSSGLDTLDVTNCTFWKNTATNMGGGLLNVDLVKTVSIGNSIFRGNSDPSGSGETAQVAELLNTPTIAHSCIQGWTGAFGGAGNHGLDPLFVDADGDDDVAGTADDELRLKAGSPCADAGDGALLPPDGADLDQDLDLLEPSPLDRDGLARRTDDPGAPDVGAGAAPQVDMGAFERPCGPLAYGAGCPGTGGFVPALALTGCTATGETVTLSLTQGLGGAAALLALSVSGADEVPLGGGCTLLVGVPLLPTSPMVPLSAGGPGGGSFAAPFTLPTAPLFVPLNLQALVADPASPTGFSASNGVEAGISPSS